MSCSTQDKYKGDSYTKLVTLYRITHNFDSRRKIINKALKYLVIQFLRGEFFARKKVDLGI